MADPATALMRVAALNKRYGDQRALADVSCAANAGEVLGLIPTVPARRRCLKPPRVPVDSCEVHCGDRAPTQAGRRRVLSPRRGATPTKWVLEFFTGAYRRSRSEIATAARRTGAGAAGTTRRIIEGICTPDDMLAPIAPHPFGADGPDLKRTRQMMGLPREQASLGD